MSSTLGSIGMLMTGVAVAIGGYSVSLRVASERTAVERLHVQPATDARDVRMLQAELRMRARLPELQRWNDEVFPAMSAQGVAMAAPQAAQFLRSPLQLASYVAGTQPASPAAPRPSYAVTAPTPSATPPAAVVLASYRPADEPRAPLAIGTGRASLLRVSARPGLNTAGLEAAIDAALPSVPAGGR